MMPTAFRLELLSIIFAVEFLLPFSRAWAYRPFVSTDAAVADPKSIEIELGYFNYERERGENAFIVPKLVLNYGLISNAELVGEFSMEQPAHGSVRLRDAALSIKAVVKEGVLQEKSEISFALEAGPLLPSTDKEERRFGFEGIGIISGKVNAFTYHVNLGGGLDRANTDAFMVWGIIGELPVTPKLRVVGEINGEAVRTHTPDNSALVGLIWEAPWRNMAIDTGVRRGISRAAADWTFTAGLSLSFSLDSQPQNSSWREIENLH